MFFKTKDTIISCIRVCLQNMFKCDVCLKNFETKQSLGGHKSAAHKAGPRYSIKRKIKTDTVYTCNFCDRKTTRPGANKKHEITCDKNPNRIDKCGGVVTGTRIGKGENQFSKAKRLGNQIPDGNNKGKKVGKPAPKSDKGLENLRRRAIERGIGGVAQSRWIRYNDKILGSSYELAVVKSLDENNIKWDTCKRFSYIDPLGNKRTYTPDIYLVDYNVYLDPKNDFLINNINPKLGFFDKEKIKLVEDQCKIRVLILNKNQLCWDSIKLLL